MSTDHPDVASWDDKARDWHFQVGAEGDSNRQLNSDPVLWRFAGKVEGLAILDAGCGTGYLAIKLARAGAQVRGVDYSEEMIRVARENIAAAGVDVPVQVDSISQLNSVPAGAIDLIVSNYVLMDCADLDGAVAQFERVLRPGGRAVLVFSHPCFSDPMDHSEGGPVYHWKHPYFEETRVTVSWGHFRSPFVFYHRPLSRYWDSFRNHGFNVIDFAEPVMQPPYPPDMTFAQIQRARSCPWSVAFHLRKPINIP